MTGKEKRELKTLIREMEMWEYMEVWQSRPWTAVRMVMDGFDGFGFSKVSHPDEWDESFGKELALRKAIANMIREMPQPEADALLERMRGEKRLLDRCCQDGQI